MSQGLELGEVELEVSAQCGLSTNPYIQPPCDGGGELEKIGLSPCQVGCNPPYGGPQGFLNLQRVRP